jgi:hypothetical protein
MRFSKYLVEMCGVMVLATAVVLAFVSQSRIKPSPNTGPKAAQSVVWKQIKPDKLAFTARLPQPIEHATKSIQTPYGEVPVHTFTGMINPAHFVIAVTEYDPQVAADFTEEERYDSAANETPKALGGKLLRNEPIKQGDFTGRDRVIEVPGRATLHFRVFLVKNRLYQVQVTNPSEAFIDPSAEQLSFDSFVITAGPNET